ncbi:TraR/DksA family transcriptional regulator [Halovulum sp. GXIMD14793]
MTDIAKRKAQLEQRLADLDNRLHEIEDTLDQPVPKDFEDRASEREEDEVLETMGQSGLEEVAMIRAALVRMAEGTYGDCVRCGENISEARLDLLPQTPFCRTCAR